MSYPERKLAVGWEYEDPDTGEERELLLLPSIDVMHRWRRIGLSILQYHDTDQREVQHLLFEEPDADHLTRGFPIASPSTGEIVNWRLYEVIRDPHGIGHFGSAERNVYLGREARLLTDKMFGLDDE
jgi:hypothetical protein